PTVRPYAAWFLTAWLAMEHGIEREQEALYRGMSLRPSPIRGGGEPLYAGLCYCTDCQKASGSAFTPFMGFASSPFALAGAPCSTQAANGGDAVRNSCPVCGSLVFGGVVGKDSSFTIYADTLDDPFSFHLMAAIFARSRPAWAVIISGVQAARSIVSMFFSETLLTARLTARTAKRSGPSGSTSSSVVSRLSHRSTSPSTTGMRS